MACRIRDVLDRRAAAFALIFVLAAVMVFGAAIYSVHKGATTDEQICKSVQSVRDDLVLAIHKIEVRALQRATTPAEKAGIKQAYEEDLVSTISRPPCS